MRAVTIINRGGIAASLLTCMAMVAGGVGSQVPRSDVIVSPITELRSGWLDEGVESPNGRFFVFRSDSGATFIRYDRSTRTWASAAGISLGSQLKWSPDGRFLAFARKPGNHHEAAVWVVPIDPSTGIPRNAARRISARPGSWPAWSPDSRRIAFSAQDSGRFRLVVVPFNGGDEEVFYDDRGSGGDLAWSPKGDYLLAGHRPGSQTPIYSLRVNTATKRVDTLPFGALRMLGYSADGKLVARYAPSHFTVVVSSASDGRPLRRLRVPSNVVPTGWSSSVRGAFSGIEHISLSHVQRVSVNDGRAQSLTPIDSGASGAFGDVLYSPDGRLFAFERPIAGNFRLSVGNSDGSGLRSVGEPSSAPGYIAFRWSPSGKQIAYSMGGVNDGIRVVEVASGADRELVRPRADNTEEPVILQQHLAWRSDGRAVRYIWAPRGELFPDREAREVTLNGRDERLATFAAPANARFVNDSLLLLKKDNGIDGINLRTGTLRSLYKGAIRMSDDFGVSADGTWVSFIAVSNGITYPRLLSLATGESRRIPYTLTGDISTILFHPDSRNFVASVCLKCPAGEEKWDVVLIPMNGEAPRVLTANEPSYKGFGKPHVSPDGRYVILDAERSYNTRAVTIRPR